MEWILNHWELVLTATMLICGVIVSIIRFAKLGEAERYEQIRGWLLQAVLMAEKEFGSGTGKLKLSSVYSWFCKQLPWLAKIVSFDAFSVYVDDALEEMRDVIQQNDAIAAVVKTKEQSVNEKDEYPN